MTGRRGRWSRSLLVSLLALAAIAARADQTVNYVVQGQTGTALWGLGNEPGTEVLAFAFSEVATVKPDTTAAPDNEKTPPPGPRVVFSVTQWAIVNGEWVRRQWYGDAALPAKALAIAADLGQGTLDATVPGFLEERTQDGATIRRDVPGRLQVQWVASGRPANSSTAYSYQTPAYATTLQTAGTGRAAKATGTITIDGFGGPIGIWGLGGLAGQVHGLLSVTTQ